MQEPNSKLASTNGRETVVEAISVQVPGEPSSAIPTESSLKAVEELANAKPIPTASASPSGPTESAAVKNGAEGSTTLTSTGKRRTHDQLNLDEHDKPSPFLTGTAGKDTQQTDTGDGEGKRKRKKRGKDKV